MQGYTCSYCKGLLSFVILFAAPCPIHKELVCNGVSDCDDSSDEAECPTKSSPSAQSPDGNSKFYKTQNANLIRVVLKVKCHDLRDLSK